MMNNAPFLAVIPPGGASFTSSDSDDHRTFLEGVIVLEEFCKELAAIVFVKHHAVLQQKQ